MKRHVDGQREASMGGTVTPPLKQKLKRRRHFIKLPKIVMDRPWLWMASTRDMFMTAWKSCWRLRCDRRSCSGNKVRTAMKLGRVMKMGLGRTMHRPDLHHRRLFQRIRIRFTVAAVTLLNSHLNLHPLSRALLMRLVVKTRYQMKQQMSQPKNWKCPKRLLMSDWAFSHKASSAKNVEPVQSPFVACRKAKVRFSVETAIRREPRCTNCLVHGRLENSKGCLRKSSKRFGKMAPRPKKN